MMEYAIGFLVCYALTGGLFAAIALRDGVSSNLFELVLVALAWPYLLFTAVR